MQRDVETFISLLPDGGELSKDLDAIVLTPGRKDAFGYHTAGVVHLCAWPDDWDIFYPEDSIKSDRPLLERLGVPIEKFSTGYKAHFNFNTARAFMLFEVMLHELGHHHDAITNSSGRVVRGNLTLKSTLANTAI